MSGQIDKEFTVSIYFYSVFLVEINSCNWSIQQGKYCGNEIHSFNGNLLVQPHEHGISWLIQWFFIQSVAKFWYIGWQSIIKVNLFPAFRICNLALKCGVFEVHAVNACEMAFEIITLLSVLIAAEPKFLGVLQILQIRFARFIWWMRIALPWWRWKFFHSLWVPANIMSHIALKFSSVHVVKYKGEMTWKTTLRIPLWGKYSKNLQFLEIQACNTANFCLWMVY